MAIGTVIPNATQERLPQYLAYLKIKQKLGMESISSTRIAEDLRLTPILVRKDLASVCQAGRPKTGYPLDTLIDDLEQFLGYNNAHEAFLIGAGELGRALLGHDQFGEYGLQILAAFDTNPKLVGTEINEKPVLPMRKLPSLVRRMQVRIAILAVPKESAQAACDDLVGCGIRAIWNFSGTHLETPEHIIIKTENLAASFALLCKQLAEAMQTK